MEPFSIIRRAILGLFGTAFAVMVLVTWPRFAGLWALVRRALAGVPVVLAALLLAGVAHGNELGFAAIPTTHQIVVHDADETLRDWCQSDDSGRLWLTLPGGMRFELVTSITDPAITNPGDGAFHPFDAGQVRDALEAVRYPLGSLAADVFILPYPRRLGLSSAAGPGLILLSPGVLPLSSAQQHAEFTHELGHVVQYSRLPDADRTTWSRYRDMRGIDDTSVYWDGACHADRPHEIFAEDFRVLFGDPLAAGSGNIENSIIDPPAQIPGLADFIGMLSGRVIPGLHVGASPVTGSVTFSRDGDAASALDLFDVAGRRLVTLAPRAVSGGVVWSWDGRDAAGRRVGPGVVFARARDGRGVARVTVLH